MSFSTDQEAFWAGSFGNEYISRNQSEQLFASNLNFFSKILENTSGVTSIHEFGANIGMNTRALKLLAPKAKLSALEINEKACQEIRKIPGIQVFNQTIYDFDSSYKADLVFFKGVLIHLNPEKLPEAYKIAYEASNKYILIAEYYNPRPVAIDYRGHQDRLFKRDFAGEMMSQFMDLKLVDYGFSYHKDPNFPQDDITWFLLSK